jgi:hypothetical protein
MTPLRQRMLEELQRRLSREPDYAESSQWLRQALQPDGVIETR